MASIKVIQGPDKGRNFELRSGDNIIGRQGSHVQLSDRTITRQHSHMWHQNGRWLLEDLGSANGTFLNGVKLVTPAPVKRGDQIRCGSSLLVFAGESIQPTIHIDDEGNLVDAAIVARLPSSEDSIIIPTPEAGAQAIDNLRILYSLISEISSTFDIDVLLHRTLDKTLEVLTADRGYIILIDEDGNLDVKAAHAAEGSIAQDVPISRTIINEVVQKQVGILSSNAMSDKRFTSGKSVHDFGIRSAICVPIKGRERILGVIHVDCSISDQTYSTEQLRLMTAIGYQTGLVIENVRLYQEAIQTERLAAVGETTAIVSHHIKNILQALGAGTEVVEIGLNRDDLAKAKDAWPIVQRNLARINALILNMLAFSKAREPLAENININHVLNECIELQMPAADEREIALLSDLDDLPPIPADAAGLRQAFTNLLTNAMDAVSNQEGAITASSRYDSMNRCVIVNISDNGRGIERNELHTIFDPFYSSKGQKGTGLGLAVARKVVEEHHGKIKVSSKVGEGTTFTMTLPVIHAGEADETSTPATTPESS